MERDNFMFLQLSVLGLRTRLPFLKQFSFRNLVMRLYYTISLLF